MNAALQNITVATTGASGSIFLRELLRLLEADRRVQTVNFIASDNALRVMAEELGIRGRRDLVAQLLGKPGPTFAKSGQMWGTVNPRPTSAKSGQMWGTSKASKKIQQQNNDDIGANVASGSYPTDAMIVIPCSMGTLAKIANGLATQLIERAADVCLKERRPLVLCVRESPLNKIHLRNLYRAADAGATIFPLIPTFYNHPATVDDMARQFAARVLAFLGLPQDGAFLWKGDR
jgi:4-hydroxy-3-polyprenylbenzoate decarboxylase